MKFINLDATTAYNKAIKSCGKDTKVIVCGTQEDLTYIEDTIESRQHSPKEIIKASASINPDTWLTEQINVIKNEIDLPTITGRWPSESKEKQSFSLAQDIMTGEPITDLVGAKIKTDRSWKIPAYFNFGGWNQCPAPKVHCALWKYWQKTYGAHIVAVSNDLIEAHISNPPTTKEDAMALAWQQYAYCNDIVDQGVESVAKLASMLINHDSWYFWWD